ncbi:hypothetical protein HAZT_HAZT003153 [Hyalella azteca]|uniref:protein-tyrosine-phosphatase n=1 Tax=Hyalella azteca TaxID=294128 RepID=A0A6A0GR81_HYAAZ|nr:hypothetical protein HAZT_HAZT003153 [Hyalella azteca]
MLSKGELRKYRSPSLLSVYLKHNIQVHYHPFEDGSAPSIDLAMNILDKVFDLLQNGGRILIHCMSGVGRTGTIAACLLQWLDEDLSPDASVVAVRSIRGNHAVHSVKVILQTVSVGDCFSVKVILQTVAVVGDCFSIKVILQTVAVGDCFSIKVKASDLLAVGDGFRLSVKASDCQ